MAAPKEKGMLYSVLVQSIEKPHPVETVQVTAESGDDAAVKAQKIKPGIVRGVTPA